GEDEHGDAGLGDLRLRVPGRGGAAHGRGPARPRAGRRARCRVSVWRPVRGGCDRQPGRDRKTGPAPVAHLLLVWPSPPGVGAAGVGRPARECPGCTAGAAGAGPGEQSCAAPCLERPHVVELGQELAPDHTAVRGHTPPPTTGTTSPY